jgi:hypothetical protein
MLRRQRTPSRFRWIFPALAFVLLFGHICDAGSSIELLVSSHQDDHHHDSADHHTRDIQIGCGAVDAISNTDCAQTGPRVDLAVRVPSDDPDVARLIVWPRHEIVTKLRSRPPLFLLHAALLI